MKKRKKEEEEQKQEDDEEEEEEDDEEDEEKQATTGIIKNTVKFDNSRLSMIVDIENEDQDLNAFLIV